MSKLKAKNRAAIPRTDFAGPARSFPIENKAHARAAISGATRSEHAGNISKTEADRVKAKARRKLGIIEEAADEPGNFVTE